MVLNRVFEDNNSPASTKQGSPDQRCASTGSLAQVESGFLLSDYLKFVVYCLLLLLPVYAIANSAVNGNWIMMIVDALLVPVGFVHGILLIFDELTS